MSSFDVVTGALTGASSQIGGAAVGAGDARASTSSASSQAGAFEGEPIGATFTEMCSRAQSTTEELERTLRSLAHCVQAAAEGYLITDQGIAHASSVAGAVGTRGAQSSPQGGARP